MIKHGYNFNKFQGDEYLIIPISMSRIANSQTPEECYKQVLYFTDKLSALSSEVVFIYTNGLYFNSTNISFEDRQKMNMQVLNHSISLRKIIDSDKKFVIRAFHFIPIDFFILNSFEYIEMFNKLKKVEKEDENLRKNLTIDFKGREYTEANINFIFEEIVVEHLLREQFIELPKVLVRDDSWRLFSYPGNTMHTTAYIEQNNILEKNKKCKNIFRSCVYNYSEKVLEVFEEIIL